MARIQKECEWTWKEKQKELALLEAENPKEIGGGKIDFESGKINKPKKKFSENSTQEIQKMLVKRIVVVKRDIVIQDDQDMV